MKRREFVLGIGGAAAYALAAAAQEVAPGRRVGVLIFGAEDDPVAQVRAGALRDGLKMLDWVEGRNLRLDFRFAGADRNRLQSYAEELVGMAPDAIVTGAAPATRAVKQLTQTIPIVFVEVTNATAFGLGSNVARPAENATGITNLYLAIGARWVEFLKQAAPRTRKIAVLFNPEFNSSGYLAAIEAAAATSDVKAIKAPIRNAEDIKRAVVGAANEPNGALMVVPPSPPFADIELIFRLATQYRLPAMYPTQGFANAGGLMAYGTDSAELFRNAASFVDRILRGAKPSDLTIQFPTKFELVVNLKVAKSIGLHVPQSLLARAKVIE
jgi:putative tryptophan/tyrosine transport system substrate-binding protein